MKPKLFLILALLCAAAQGAWAEGQYISGESGPLWEYDETTKTLTISGTGDMPDFSWGNEAPWEDVKSQIEHVSIAEGITRIGEEAFEWCNKFSAVTIPSTVTSIGFSAFSFCKSLESITIPDNVTSMDGFVFYGCSGLTSATIGNGLTIINRSTFNGCEKLETVTIGSSVETIETNTFNECTALTTVNFSVNSHLTTIKNCAFYGSGIKTLVLPNSLTTTENYMFSSCKNLEEVTFGTGITHIAFYSFMACSALKRLTIPAGVVSMGAFFDNTNMEDVYCWADPAQLYWWSNKEDFKPNKGTLFHVTDKAAWETTFPEANVTFVGDLQPAGSLIYSVDTGQGVAHVTGITGTNPTGVVMIPATYTDASGTYPVTTIASEAFKGKTGLTAVSFPNVSVIAASAFEGCTGLTTLYLPSTLTSIGTEAFKGCTGLRSVVIDASFGGSLFAGCDNISSITFGENITSIGAMAFQNLPGLTSVTIPANVTTIGAEAFDGCANLATITFLGETPPETDGAQFYGIASNFVMRVPTGSVDAYRAHSIWGNNKATHIECMPWSGSGTESAPYLITHKDELDLLAKRVNEGNTYFETYFKVTKDIAYDPSALYFDGGKSNYIPIGNSYSYNSDFWGIFDGDYHKISGIRIDRSSSSNRNDLALFGRSMKYEAVIKNVILDDAQISGKDYIAGILACGSCTVTNCHVTKSVIINTCYNDAFFHGGIAGMTYGMSVNHCSSAATLTITDGFTKHNYYGAITGHCWGELHYNLAIGATVPSAGYQYGALTGYIGGAKAFSHNYYTSCTVDGNANALDAGSSSYIYEDGHATTEHPVLRDVTTDDGAVPALRNDADNSTALGLFAALPATLDLGFGAGKYPMQLAGRTLYRDGSWNTLCLPFDVVLEDSPLEGATVKEFSSADFNNGTLTLNFTDATSIEAGKPYLIKWDTTGEPIVSPVFTNVTVSGTTPSAIEYGPVTFQGTYKQLSFEEDDNTKLYLGADNTLYYPAPKDAEHPVTIGAQRAYFQLNGLTAGEPSTGNIRAFVLRFGEDDSTQEVTTPLSQREAGGETIWYDMQGRRLNGKPTTKGLYIKSTAKGKGAKTFAWKFSR